MVKKAARRVLGQTIPVCDLEMEWDMVHFDVQLVEGADPVAAREAILGAGPDEILRRIVRDHDVVRIPVASASVLLDLDTPADLTRLERANDDGGRARYR